MSTEFECHKTCCICEICECNKTIQTLEDIGLDSDAQENRVKSFMTDEHICAECVADILKKIELEHAQAHCAHRFYVFANHRGDFLWGAYQCEHCKVITDDHNALYTNPDSVNYDPDFKLVNFNVLKLKDSK